MRQRRRSCRTRGSGYPLLGTAAGPGGSLAPCLPLPALTHSTAATLPHPPAPLQILVELAELQDQEVGDGTTSVVIVAAELLKRANELVRQRIHPTSIISGYRLAMREVGWQCATVWGVGVWVGAVGNRWQRQPGQVVGCNYIEEKLAIPTCCLLPTACPPAHPRIPSPGLQVH